VKDRKPSPFPILKQMEEGGGSLLSFALIESKSHGQKKAMNE
jgi:hypothetical protein